VFSKNASCGYLNGYYKKFEECMKKNPNCPLKKHHEKKFEGT